MLTPEQWQSISALRGWLSLAEANALFEEARRAEGAIIEIGTWEGKSTIVLALGARAGHGARVVTIDPHTFGSDLDALRRNLADHGVSAQIEVVVGRSEEVATTFTGPVSFVFIDGEHKLASVRRDFESWEPHLRMDGRIAFHDTLLWPGPRRFVDRHVISSGRFADISLTGSLVVGTKVSAASAHQREQNAKLLLKKRIKTIREFAALLLRSPKGFYDELRLHRLYG